MVKVANRAKAGRGFNVRRPSGQPHTEVVLPGETREPDLADPGNPVYQGMVDAGDVEIEGMRPRGIAGTNSPLGRHIDLVMAVTSVNERSGRQDGRDLLINALRNGVLRAEAPDEAVARELLARGSLGGDEADAIVHEDGGSRYNLADRLSPEQRDAAGKALMQAHNAPERSGVEESLNGSAADREGG